MSDSVDDGQSLLNEHVGRRSIIPLLRPPVARRALRFSVASEQVPPSARSEGAEDLDLDDYPDPEDVQGDVIYLFPKARLLLYLVSYCPLNAFLQKAQNFIFFRIADARAFKQALGTFLGQVTTSRQNADFILEIAQWKANPLTSGLITKANSQIAFSRMGLYAVGIREATGDTRFDKYAMRDNKTFLTDQRDWDPAFEKTNFDPVNGSVNDDAGALHGVISCIDAAICASTAKLATDHFGSSMTVISVEEGRARPPPWVGHEHFGYEDGISQPALR